jgi:SAM-dependent methyltransferase
MNPRPHWDRIYATKAADEVSWFQREPALSLELIERVAGPDAAVVDVGGGASTLVDRLLDRGFGNVTVLDVSEAALQVSRARLGARAAQVRWVADDVRTHPFAPNSIDVWHDRAVFHFLTAEDDRRRYVEQVARGVRSGGHVIVATFAEDVQRARGAALLTGRAARRVRGALRPRGSPGRGPRDADGVAPALPVLPVYVTENHSIVGAPPVRAIRVGRRLRYSGTLRRPSRPNPA